MDEPTQEKDSKASKCQSQLTTAFFAPRSSQTPRKSPYFEEPETPIGDDAAPSENGDRPTKSAPFIESATSAPASSMNLFPERRNNLARSTNPPLLSTKSSTALAAVAAETKKVLPGLLKDLPECWNGRLVERPSALGARFNPRHPPTTVRVLNADALDTALAIAEAKGLNAKSVLVLNMANAYHGGGGWLMGALAQEEALCYRSTLSVTLKRKFYPLPDEGAVYSPKVAVLRDALSDGHLLQDLSQPSALPLVSVVSVAAQRDPKTDVRVDGREVYRYQEDRDAMKEKMRAVLRVAGRMGHGRLVLGALGRGALRNPREEVCLMWKEVLGETEFRGWWEDVAFAVLEEGADEDGDGNYGVFYKGLNGLTV